MYFSGMWTCPYCVQKFVKENQTHSCNDRQVEDFLKGKPAHIVELFHYFIAEYSKIADFRLHPAKHRIAFAAKTRYGYIHRVGKDFIDIVLHFSQPYEDNLCFYKIATYPGAGVWNHYIRLQHKGDINDEVKMYLKMAHELGS